MLHVLQTRRVAVLDSLVPRPRPTCPLTSSCLFFGINVLSNASKGVPRDLVRLECGCGRRTRHNQFPATQSPPCTSPLEDEDNLSYDLHADFPEDHIPGHSLGLKLNIYRLTSSSTT